MSYLTEIKEQKEEEVIEIIMINYSPANLYHMSIDKK